MSTGTNELPELPELPICAYWWSPKADSGLSQNLACWSMNPGPHPQWDVTRFIPADQLRARDRQIVELCAQIADDMDFGMGQIGVAIRSLLQSQK